MAIGGVRGPGCVQRADARSGGQQAEHRMMYTALLYTPEKEHTRYLVDFELDVLAEQVRSQARAVGIAQVSDLIAVTDGGNGLEEALQRHLADNLTTILDCTTPPNTSATLRRCGTPATRKPARSGSTRRKAFSMSKEARPCSRT